MEFSLLTVILLLLFEYYCQWVSFRFSMPEVPYKYFMTVSPLDGKLYISDYQSKKILRVKTMGAVRDLTENMEVIAGTGDQCVPGDKNKCGDNGPAVNADLFYPKGKHIQEKRSIEILKQLFCDQGIFVNF